jgi:hypothetical protein
MLMYNNKNEELCTHVSDYMSEYEHQSCSTTWPHGRGCRASAHRNLAPFALTLPAKLLALNQVVKQLLIVADDL